MGDIHIKEEYHDFGDHYLLYRTYQLEDPTKEMIDRIWKGTKWKLDWLNKRKEKRDGISRA